MPTPDGGEVELAFCNGHGCALSTTLPISAPWLLLMTPGATPGQLRTEHYHDGACLGVAMAFQAITQAQATTTDPQAAARLDRVATALFDLQPGVQRIVTESLDVESVNYLIWSNEHRAWWRPTGRGYTEELAEAGAHTADEAAYIALTAAHGGLCSKGVVLVSDYRSSPDHAAALRNEVGVGGPS